MAQAGVQGYFSFVALDKHTYPKYKRYIHLKRHHCRICVMHRKQQNGDNLQMLEVAGCFVTRPRIKCPNVGRRRLPSHTNAHSASCR